METPFSHHNPICYHGNHLDLAEFQTRALNSSDIKHMLYTHGWEYWRAYTYLKNLYQLWYTGDSSRKHLRTKVTPDFHLKYSKNWGNLGSESK